MAPLTTFPLPLPPNGPPQGFNWEDREMSDISATTAFEAGIDQRDTYLGEHSCVICGRTTHLQRCHISMKSEPDVWTDLRNRNWIPHQAKKEAIHEPRNGLLMCLNHQADFNDYSFFIRFVPDTGRYIFVNFSGDKALQPHHGKAMALDYKHKYAPYPSLFIIHEMRVRGFHPFRPVDLDVPDEVPWQDWIVSSGVLNDGPGDLFQRAAPDEDYNTPGRPSQLQLQPMTQTTDGTPSGKHRLALNDNVIADILAATRAMPSWKACVQEGTSWDGTAQENIEKYVTSIGVEEEADQTHS